MENRLTEGKPFSVILRFMLPLVIGNICQQLYNLVDTIIVGRFVGPTALAAVGSTGTIMFFIVGTCTGMVTGFSIITSQKYGAGETEEVKKSVSNGLILSFIIIVLSTVVTVAVIKPVLQLMNTPEDIFDYAYDYISIICLGIFATVTYNFFSAVLRAIGNSRIPLISLIISASLNIGLDLLFIIVFEMGTAGAAIATVLSQAVSALFCLIYILLRVPELKPSRSHWRPSRIMITGELMQGIPMALQTGITASGTMIMQSAINLFGSIAVAGVTAASKLQMIMTQAMFTSGQTMAAYVGQNYGKGDYQRIREGIKAALKMFVVYSIAAAVITMIILPYVLPVFFEEGVDITDYLPWARIYIVECSICYFFLAMVFIYRSAIQAVGHGFTAMLMGVAELSARLVMSVISMIAGSFYLAVASDPFAWIVAAMLGLFIFVRLMRKIEKQNAAAPELSRAQNAAVPELSRTSRR